MKRFARFTRKRFFYTVVLSGVLSLTPAPFAAGDLLEAPVFEHAARLRADGDFISLIDDLARMLIFDDTNQSACQQLLAFATHPDVPSEYRLRIYQLEGLYKQRANVRARLQEQTRVGPRLRQSLELLGGLPSPADAVPRVFDPDQLLTSGHFVLIPDENQINHALQVLTSQILQETVYYTNELTVALRDNDTLRNELRKREAAISGVINRPGFSRGATAGLDPAIGQMKDDLMVVHGEVGLLRDEVEARNRQIDRLSDELLALSLDSGEKDRKISQKVEDMGLLKTELEDLEARFRFGQVIIEQKDLQIMALEEKMNELGRAMTLFQASFHEDMRLQETRLAELSGIIEIYRAKLRDAVDDNLAKQHQIRQLSGDVTVLRQAVGDKDPFLNHALSSLSLLRDEVRSMSNQVYQLTQDRNDPATSRHLTLKLQNLEHQLETTRAFLEKTIPAR